MPKRKWILKERVPDDFIAQFAGYPKNLLKILYHRGLRDEQALNNFLRPVYGDTFYDPLLLPDMQKGIDRLVSAIEKKEAITVYADYDADAVTAAAVVVRALRALGAKVDHYIPNRFLEGYGVNNEALAEIAKRGTKVIITVDCGITSVEEVETAKSLGIDTVITDHHHVPEILPKAVAVINPHRPDSGYPFKDLTGVGVAFKFVQGLIAAYDPEHKILPPGFEKWLLDLVAIGTIADCQNLLGENRVLVKYGLLVLGKTRWPGLKALLSVARSTFNNNGKDINTGTVAFQIAPRINAAGRITHADTALNLLLTDDPLEAGDLALTLENLNRQRQKLSESVIGEAREQLNGLKETKVLMATSVNWPKGVMGLVAGKLAEEFYRPVLIASIENEVATGSARSIPNFSIIEALTYAGTHALRFGGHAAAAGFTVERAKVEDFYQAVLKYADENLQKENMEPFIFVDAELNAVEDFSLDFAEQIDSLAPFGQGNPKPQFLLKNLSIFSVKAVGGDGKHAQLLLTHPQAPSFKLRCIAFSHGYLASATKQGDTIDLVGELMLNEWRGNKDVQFRLVDWRRAGDF